MIEPGDRVTDLTRPYCNGKLLRIETYPGTGSKKWATVLWDWAISTRRVELGDLGKIHLSDGQGA